MSALPKDEFAIEMLHHFLETTIELLNDLKIDPSFSSRFPELCLEWEQEARGNGLLFLGDLLLRLHSAAPQQTVCEQLAMYLFELKSTPDSEELKLKHSTSNLAPAEEKVGTFLQCRSGHHRFLLPVENVVEISRWKTINPLPRADQRVRGLIAFRGQGTPVFKLDAETPAASTVNLNSEKSFFVICELDKIFFAIEVNSTDEVFKIKSSEFQASSKGDVGKFVNRGEQILLLLDLEKLVRP